MLSNITTFFNLCMYEVEKGGEGFPVHVEIIALDNERTRLMTNITHNDCDIVKFVTHVQSSLKIGPGIHDILDNRYIYPI